MLQLNIVESCSAASRPPHGMDVPLEVWHYPDGRVSGCGRTFNGHYWIELPDLATFHFTTRGGTVAALPQPPTSQELVREAYYREVLPLALQVLGSEALHASAVLGPCGVVGFGGLSGAGKSTVAYGLSLRGYASYSDDALIFETSDQGVRAIPVHFQVRLRVDCASLFAQAPPPASHPAIQPAPLAALAVLKRHPSEQGVHPLPSTEALPEILSHAYCFSLRDAARKRLMMEHYLDLIARVPVFEVRFGDGPEKLSAILDSIEQVILT